MMDILYIYIYIYLLHVLTILNLKYQVSFFAICRTKRAYYKGCINKLFILMQINVPLCGLKVTDKYYIDSLHA